VDRPPRTQGRPAAPSTAAAVRGRRRPALVGLALALVALGGLSSWWLVRTTSATVPVLAVAGPVERGQVIERTDLAVVQARLDPAVAAVPATDLDAVVEQVAATGLVAGALLAPGAVADDLVPGPGSSLVGVALTAAQRPGAVLVPGDPVRVVDTPAPQADAPLAAQLRALREQDGTDPGGLGLLLVGDGRPYTRREITAAVGLPVVATLAWDPGAAEVLAFGAPQPRRWELSELVTSAGTAVTAAEALLRHARDQVRGPGESDNATAAASAMPAASAGGGRP
jgi:hypothetical protein